MNTNTNNALEVQRLATLAKLRLVGGPDEPALDRLVNTAALVFDVPICAVSLVGESDEWFKARCGVSTTSGPRQTAFCSYTIQSNDVLVVENALNDERFKNNPQVTGPDAIRFYAGAPIIAENGSRIGAFCLKDRKPRTFNERDVEILRSFAAMAMSEIMHRLAVKTALAASKAKSCFLAGMNYGVRTPLTSIFGYSELLMEADLAPEDRDDAVKCIRRSGEALMEFVDDVVLLAELQCDGVESRPRDFVLRDLLRDVEANVASLAKAKKLELDFTTMIDVPSMLHADPVLLRQALSHLLANAVKFTDAGSIALHVRNGPREGDVRFEVCDTGRGMSSQQLATIWDPFEVSSAGLTRGLGVGLPIVARLAALMHGAVVARSTPGLGSIFTLDVNATAPAVSGHDEARAAA